MQGAVQGIVANRQGWALFMMKEELGLEQPEPRQALKTALFIGGSYLVRGNVPLSPYALMKDSKSHAKRAFLSQDPV